MVCTRTVSTTGAALSLPETKRQAPNASSRTSTPATIQRVGPCGRLAGAALAAIDLQILQFRVHESAPRLPASAVRISFFDAMRAGKNPPTAPSTTANAMPISHDLRRHLKIERQFGEVARCRFRW